jgi:hypothetical protein
MAYRRLFVLVEGDDDERFFSRIINPELEERYDSVQLWKYAEETKKKTNSLLRSIHAMKAEYIFLTDINFAPCISARKQKTRAKFQNVEICNIMVVVKEIESWYLAGLDADHSKKMQIPDSEHTNDLTKEQFDNLIPDKFMSRVDFMQETLKHFDIEIAKQKNQSFSYFLNKKCS